MALTLNGSTGLSGIVGSAGTPALQGTDTNTGYFFGTDILGLSTGGSERLRITSGGEIRIGGNEGGYKLNVIDQSNRTTTAETGLLLYAKHDGSGTTGAGFGTGIRFWGDRASGNIEQNMGRIMCIADVNSGTTLSSAFTFETGVAGVLGEKLRITSAGDVGIGVSPSSGIKLHIKDTTSDGAIKLEGTGSTLGTWITLQNNDATANSYSMIQGADAGGQGTSEIKFINVNNSNNEGTLTVGTRPSGGSMQERLRIKSNGQIGINMAPSADAQVCIKNSDDSNYNVFDCYNDNGNKLGGFSQDSTGNGSMGVRTNAGTLNTFFRSSGISYLNAGNVGIGTTTPSTKLSLEGADGSTSNGILIGAKNASGIRGVVEVHTAASTVGFNLSRTGGGSDTDVVRLEMDADSNGLIQVRNSSNTQRVRLDTHGIKFGTDTAEVNALDDYEEGNWTPSYDTSGATGTISNVTYATQIGKYVKIGKMVHIEGTLKTSAITKDQSGTYDIAGLPYPCVNSTAIGGVFTYLQSNWTNAPHSFDVVANTSRMRARQGVDVGDGSYTTGNTNDFNTNAGNHNRIYFSGQYRAQ
jgi:hypothetical protein